MSLEDAMLSEKSQAPKDEHCRMPPREGPERVNFVELESRTLTLEGRGNWLLMRAEFQFRMMRRSPADGCQ